MPSDESFSKEEVERRREAALKRMLNTPHKPHAESALSRKKKKAKAPAKPKARAI
jgi:hypothetical protein